MAKKFKQRTWSVSDKKLAIKNLAEAKIEFDSADGDRKVYLKRYISMMTSKLKKKGITSEVNPQQPRLENFEKVVPMIHLDELMIKKIIEGVTASLAKQIKVEPAKKKRPSDFSGFDLGRFFIKGEEVSKDHYTGYLAGVLVHQRRLVGEETSKDEQMVFAKKIVDGLLKKKSA